MNKLFSELKALCKTADQRKAFNELISTFSEKNTIVYGYKDDPGYDAFYITVSGDDVKNIYKLSKDPEFVYEKHYKSSRMPFDVFKKTTWKSLMVRAYINKEDLANRKTSSEIVDTFAIHDRLWNKIKDKLDPLVKSGKLDWYEEDPDKEFITAITKKGNEIWIRVDDLNYPDIIASPNFGYTTLNAFIGSYVFLDKAILEILKLER